jgi:ribA/ribD-fused uncharacterized protein
MLIPTGVYMMTDQYVFFWDGPFSQWAYSRFTIDGMTFNTCEQWMMYNKAIMFNDELIVQRIMNTRDPSMQKLLGKKVKGFNDQRWMEDAYNIVKRGNLAKFQQNVDFMNALIETKGKILVEASPYDTRWGIGMGANDTGVEDPANWRGLNLLGKAITEVRVELLGA